MPSAKASPSVMHFKGPAFVLGHGLAPEMMGRFLKIAALCPF